ncbi:MAG TPA: hypothetical protein PKD53_22445 [Chloroflexaceae bacterium]|nr:hypothetical protein [Chloroflexaceae bacterium]
MELYHDGVRLGALTRHFYETPWASAWLVADDPAAVARYAAICALHACVEQLPDELPCAEANARYEQELAARGLDETQLDGYWRPWVVVMPDGERREITPPHVEPDGYLTWRW